jgi:cytochrome c-type biogenesis protein CcmH
MTIQAMGILGLAALLVAGAIGWVARAYVRAGGRNRAGQILAAGGFALAVLGLYLAVGKPNVPGLPLKARVAALEARVQAGGLDAVTPEELLAVLEARAKADPAAIVPRLYAGLILSGLGRDEEAARAFDAVLRRDPRNARASLELGRVLARINGPNDPATLAQFAHAAELAPKDPLPWFYQGLAASAQGQRNEAIRFWQGAQARFAPDDPRQAMVSQMLADARKLPQTTSAQRS